MSLRVIKGSLFDLADTHILCHQCNCTSYTPKGLSHDMFTNFPFANSYQKNSKRIPGTISVHANSQGLVQIINMYGQYYIGKPTSINNNAKDSYEKRKAYFRSCLQEMHALLDTTANIAFPQNIGCGLAGGVWDDYKNMLQEFASWSPTRDVVVVRLY